MRIWRIASYAIPVALLVAGCHTNTVDKSAFKSALDHYYSSRQECLWQEPVKFPVQADTSNEIQTRSFDALTDAGLLTRMPAEKKRFLVGSKQVNNYDLSEKGRSSWTADAAQPGYGNFCFGSPKVSSVDGYTPIDSSDSTYTVSYHYTVKLPDWANSAEMKTAFPRIATISEGRPGTANLAKSNDGWEVQNASAFLRPPAAPR
jgi:hypothetical protein